MSMNTREGSIPTSCAGRTCCMISFVVAPFPQPISRTRAPPGRAICAMYRAQMVCMAGSDARTFNDLAMVSSASRGCSLIRVYRSVTATSPLDDLRSVPAQQIFFQAPRNSEDQQYHHQDQKNQREHQGGVVGALRKRQEVAKPVGRRHELAHAGA